MESILNSKIIALHNISIVRGQQIVLEDVNWETHVGEHWFVMGNNGCGKTTLLEILMGYLWPQEGTVTLLGETYGHTFLPELRTKIGYVSTWILKRMRNDIPVEHVIASGLDSSIGWFDDLDLKLQQRIEKLLEFFHIENIKERPFGKLSSGQQLKVILARALINQPKVLILDEPFNNLDIGSRIAMYQYVEQLSQHKDCPQIILVTHHLEDITPLFTHGLFLKEGKVFQKGKRSSLLTSESISKAFDVPPSFVK